MGIPKNEITVKEDASVHIDGVPICVLKDGLEIINADNKDALLVKLTIVPHKLTFEGIGNE